MKFVIMANYPLGFPLNVTLYLDQWRRINVSRETITTVNLLANRGGRNTQLEMFGFTTVKLLYILN